MNLRCSTKPEKFKNLTLEKEYEATQDGDFVHLTNDAGQRAKYSRKYFTQVRVRRATPPAPPVVRLADALSVRCTAEGGNSLIIVLNLDGFVLNESLPFDGLAISCGIKQVWCIQRFKRACNDFYGRINHERYTGTIEDFFQYVVDIVIDAILDECGAGFIMSDQVLEDFADLDRILTDKSKCDWHGLNESSGNNIVFWFFAKE